MEVARLPFFLYFFCKLFVLSLYSRNIKRCDMERFVDWLLTFIFMFGVFLALGALAMTACSDFTWSYNILMSALCGFGVATIVWRAVD